MSDRLIDLFASVLSVESTALREDSSPENTSAWDSVTNMMLVASIEEEFGIELTSDEIVEMTTIGSARAILQKRLVAVA
jgi:acyl carrier protein